MFQCELKCANLRQKRRPDSPNSTALKQNKLFELEFGESHRVNLSSTCLSQSGALVLSSNVLDFLLPKSQLKLHCCDVL